MYLYNFNPCYSGRWARTNIKFTFTDNTSVS